MFEQRGRTRRKEKKFEINISIERIESRKERKK